jgi:hypothetical protein
MAQHLHDRVQPCTSFSEFRADSMSEAVRGYHRLPVLIDEAGVSARSFQGHLEQMRGRQEKATTNEQTACLGPGLIVAEAARGNRNFL